jgi:hypothetical protein
MATHLKEKGCTIYRDKEAENNQAITLAYDQCIKRLKKQKEEEKEIKKEKMRVAAEAMLAQQLV